MQNATVSSDTPINTEALNDMPVDDGRTIEGEIIEVKTDPAMAILDPARFAQVLFEPFVERLASTKRSASRTKVDPATPAGLAKAKEFEDAFVKIRTSADKKKTEYKKPLDLAGKKILEHFNAIADAAKAEEKKWTDIIEAEKKRLADIEAEKQRLERVRIEAIENRIYDIRQIPATLAKASAADIAAQLDHLVTRVLVGADFDEHLEAAIGAQNIAINELRQLLTDVRASEAQAAELARLRAAEAEREAKAKEEREATAKREAAMAAELDTLRRQMAEMQAAAARAAQPPAIVEPVAAEPADIEADGAGLVVGPVVMIADTVPTAELPLEQIRADMFRAPAPAEPQRPTDGQLVGTVATAFNVPCSTAMRWLSTFDLMAARADLAGGE